MSFPSTPQPHSSKLLELHQASLVDNPGTQNGFILHGKRKNKVRNAQCVKYEGLLAFSVVVFEMIT